MTNVTATASGGTYNTGVNNANSSPKIVTSIVSASGGSSSYGVFDTGGSGMVTIDSSKITGSTNTIGNNSGVTTQVGASQLAGGPVSNSGTLTCYADYDENYTAPGLAPNERVAFYPPYLSISLSSKPQKFLDFSYCPCSCSTFPRRKCTSPRPVLKMMKTGKSIERL
jgi:hypothetical protein